MKAYRRTWPGFSLKIRMKRGLEYKGLWRDHFAHEIFALRYMPNGRYFAAADWFDRIPRRWDTFEYTTIVNLLKFIEIKTCF